MERKAILSPAPSRIRILVAPLDWGLGHATRCIPLVLELMKQGVDVVLAADERPYDLLRREFPTLQIIRLPGFGVRYGNDQRIILGMLRQLPRMAASVIREHRVLRQLIENLEIDAVISDNRFGLFSGRVPCVYVTHQIAIRMPASLRWLSAIVRCMHKLVIRRYDECWVPDFAGQENLSGGLSHDVSLPPNVHFIGPLSRMSTLPSGEVDYDLLVVLSGPEPQRTIFETLVIDRLRTSRRRSLVVRGIPEKNQRMKLSDTLTVVSFLETEALTAAMQGSEIIVARPGYSTLMDLAAIGKQAILVPTPGQTEQEYLAGELRRKGLFCIQEQNNLDFEVALDPGQRAAGFPPMPSTAKLLSETVQRLLTMIHNSEAVVQA